MLSGSPPPLLRARGVKAVLGPTNTGKTYYAIERMLGHKSGMIGLPLRLLAREVYNRIVERVGKHNVALLTGEEKIKPKHAKYFVCTVESMPRDRDVAFLAVDEIQLSSDPDRGHVFTNALLNMRGTEETLLIGASTMRTIIERLIPGATIISRPRLSQLTFAGEQKITRLPSRSAIVAFSAEEVYTIAELIRRQRGGAAVVMGALSPRTRNAQVEMFQNGEVDHIVATDAIGMGLNLEIDHVAFAATRKFDGQHHRKLYPSEVAQIAGRAGRHLKDGTFGSTGRCTPFEQELIEQLESHDFDDVKTLYWRNPELDFSSLKTLQYSLGVLPQEQGVARATVADDEATLNIAASRPDILELINTPKTLRRLWDVCALPDYRKVAPHHHAELVIVIFEFLMKSEFIAPDWFAAQVELCNRPDGEIDTLSARLAQIRTWTFCANRIDWLRDPEHWQRITRRVEDNLSDALHVKLAQRFVDRRTSVLMKRLRENEMLEAEVTVTGDVVVEGQNLGKLGGFRFTPDTHNLSEDTPEAKTLKAIAAKALTAEIETRATKFSVAEDGSIALALDGAIRWQGEVVAKLQAGDKMLEPKALLLADEYLNGALRELAVARLELWLKSHIRKLLGALLDLEQGEGLTGIGRGIAFQLAENLGVIERLGVLNDVKSLDQEGRGALRKLGVRFGSYHLYLPLLLKPAARSLCAQLWLLKQNDEVHGLDDIVHMASSGRTSFPADEKISKDLYRVAGFRVCGPRAVRVDILERLADLIRPAVSFKLGLTAGEPPVGAADGDGFIVVSAMTSLVGCAGDDFSELLKSLGYSSVKKFLPVLKPVEVKVVAEAVQEEPMQEETLVTEPVVQEDVAQDITEADKVEVAIVEALVEGEAEPVTDTVVEPVAAKVVQPQKVDVWSMSRNKFEGGYKHKHKDGAQHKARVIWTRGEVTTQSGEAKPAHADRKPDLKKHELKVNEPKEAVILWVRKQPTANSEATKPAFKPKFEPKSRDTQARSGVRPDRQNNDRKDKKEHSSKGGVYASAQSTHYADKDTDSPFAKLAALKAQMEGK